MIWDNPFMSSDFWQCLLNYFLESDDSFNLYSSAMLFKLLSATGYPGGEAAWGSSIQPPLRLYSKNPAISSFIRRRFYENLD
jgi:hypothetical protein